MEGVLSEGVLSEGVLSEGGFVHANVCLQLDVVHSCTCVCVCVCVWVVRGQNPLRTKPPRTKPPPYITPSRHKPFPGHNPLG